MSTSQSDRTAQKFRSGEMQSSTRSTSAPRQELGHSSSSRGKIKGSVHKTSTVLGSRIEKRRTVHRKKTAASSVQVTVSNVLIRVYISNRLGTKTEIPCSMSDTIGAFKRVAATYLGIKPEAIMLKRQGECAFKDFLTLEDYGVHDGSSLDLEVDTGDS